MSCHQNLQHQESVPFYPQPAASLEQRQPAVEHSYRSIFVTTPIDDSNDTMLLSSSSSVSSSPPGNTTTTMTTTPTISIFQKWMLETVLALGVGIVGWYYPRYILHRALPTLAMKSVPYQTTQAGDVILDGVHNHPLVDPPTIPCKWPCCYGLFMVVWVYFALSSSSIYRAKLIYGDALFR